MIEVDWLVSTLNRALAFSTPLLWATLGEITAERAGVINLGVEGMMILGAFCGFAVAQTTGHPELGLVAGALTKSGKVGYVGAFPIPEVKRHIAAFALGVRAVNPTAAVHVRWLFAWFNPAAAKEATEALIADGVDVFAFTEDSPTVVQVAAQHNLPSFGHYSPMHNFAPQHVVSGQLVHWEKIYVDFLTKVHAGTYTPKNLQDVDYWWLLAEGAVELGGTPGVPINPVFEAPLKAVKVQDAIAGELAVYDLVIKRLKQMSQQPPAFDPFEGPITDRKGTLRVPAGKRMTQQELITMEWAAQGVVGPWANEP